MKALLISNSTNPGEAYLDYPKYDIKQFLGNKPINAIFIPFAAITFSYDEYEQKVNSRFNEIGHSITSIHHFSDYKKAIEDADAIIVGGGNTWKLVHMLHKHGLMPLIKQKVTEGIPYIGWSAGSNIACPTLRTTNDMPIIDPLGFDTIGFVPFQINPHYLDTHPSNHGGETREDRINEFITENQNTYVVGLREGTMLLLNGEVLSLIGQKSVRIFKYGEQAREITADTDLSFLLK